MRGMVIVVASRSITNQDEGAGRRSSIVDRRSSRRSVPDSPRRCLPTARVSSSGPWPWAVAVASASGILEPNDHVDRSSRSDPVGFGQNLNDVLSLSSGFEVDLRLPVSFTCTAPSYLHAACAHSDHATPLWDRIEPALHLRLFFFGQHDAHGLQADRGRVLVLRPGHRRGWFHGGRLRRRLCRRPRGPLRRAGGAVAVRAGQGVDGGQRVHGRQRGRVDRVAWTEWARRQGGDDSGGCVRPVGLFQAAVAGAGRDVPPGAPPWRRRR